MSVIASAPAKIILSGEFMNLNHTLLYAVRVSNEPIEKLIYTARKAGVLGANSQVQVMEAA
jgi:mevalonate kinase